MVLMKPAITIIPSRNTRAVSALLDQPRQRRSAIEQRVRAIVSRVRSRGDAALLTYARQLDGLNGNIEVDSAEIEAGARATPATVRRAIRTAAQHIRRVASGQRVRSHRTTVVPGVVIEQRVTPLGRVGCYVPAGRYPLPSSLLMAAVTARVAGVAEVIVVCPKPTPEIFAAALEAGVDRMFRVGGAHAIAALAYGTTRLPKVDKIVGPGSAYVAVAKSLVSGDCPIDFQAGPTEIVIVCRQGRAAWLAADLLAQAEHDVDARAVLVTPNRRLAEAVQREVTRQAPADGPSREALGRHGGIVVTSTIREAIELTNRVAPEHVVCDREDIAAEITAAGTVFVGPYAAQAAGDYATGSNHVLPTGGAARLRGGLSVTDFVRVGSVQHITRKGLATIAPTVVALAEAEGLRAHAESVRIRLS